MFESAKLKVERANRHISELSSTIDQFLANNKDQIFSMGDPEGGNGSIGINPLPAPVSFNIIIGDIAHNLRSALDHVAGEITSLATGGCPKAILTSKFPISKVPEDFEASVKKHIEPHDPGVAAELMREMKNSDVWYQTINALNLLNNTDKHRTVVVVLTSVGIAAEGVRVGGGFIGKIVAVDCGALIANHGGEALGFDKGPYPTVSVVFGEGEGFEKRPVVGQLREVSEIISKTITLCEQHSRFKS